MSDISHDNFGADDDYQWNHQPPDQAGLTINNDQFIELEFDSTETINHFTTPWWDAFHGTADESDAKAREVVDGKFAIVTGLIGLDCAHSCSTESHPVYAMAIHVQDDPADDVWAIFVRNWGNEGFCSDNDHQLAFSDNTYTFRLPWRPGASSVVASSSTVFQTNNEQVSGPAMTTQLGKAVLVSFTLPSPESHPRVNGELHLQWADAPARAMHPRVSQTPEERASEDHLGAFREMMTPAQREVFLQAMATEEDRTPDLISPAAPPLSAATSIRAQAGPISGLPQVVSVPDPNKADKDRRRWQAVRTALGGNVPGLPDDDPPA